VLDHVGGPIATATSRSLALPDPAGRDFLNTYAKLVGLPHSAAPPNRPMASCVSRACENGQLQCIGTFDANRLHVLQCGPSTRQDMASGGTCSCSADRCANSR
jgi:hypothetical protein